MPWQPPYTPLYCGFDFARESPEKNVTNLVLVTIMDATFPFRDFQGVSKQRLIK